jgi:hypothetical protein
MKLIKQIEQIPESLNPAPRPLENGTRCLTEFKTNWTLLCKKLPCRCPLQSHHLQNQSSGLETAKSSAIKIHYIPIAYTACRVPLKLML